MGTSSEEQKRNEYIQQIAGQGNSFQRQADTVFTLHLTLQIVTLIGAIVLPLVVSFSEIPKFVPTTLSAIVAIAAGLAAFLGLGERARTLYLASKTIQRESREYGLGVGVYSQFGQDKLYDRFDLFVTRVEAIWQQEEQSRFSSGVFGNVSTGSPQAGIVPTGIPPEAPVPTTSQQGG